MTPCLVWQIELKFGGPLTSKVKRAACGFYVAHAFPWSELQGHESGQQLVLVMKIRAITDQSASLWSDDSAHPRGARRPVICAGDGKRLPLASARPPTRMSSGRRPLGSLSAETACFRYIAKSVPRPFGIESESSAAESAMPKDISPISAMGRAADRIIAPADRFIRAHHLLLPLQFEADRIRYVNGPGIDAGLTKMKFPMSPFQLFWSFNETRE